MPVASRKRRLYPDPFTSQRLPACNAQATAALLPSLLKTPALLSTPVSLPDRTLSMAFSRPRAFGALYRPVAGTTSRAPITGHKKTGARRRSNGEPRYRGDGTETIRRTWPLPAGESGTRPSSAPPPRSRSGRMPGRELPGLHRPHAAESDRPGATGPGWSRNPR